jgi:hypothetical protein
MPRTSAGILFQRMNIYGSLSSGTPPVDPPPDPPPDIPNDPSAGPEWQVPIHTYTATSRDDFLTKYANAVGGDQIIVPDGLNLGILNLNRNGTNEGLPITVRIAGTRPNTSSAYLGGKLTVSGRYNTVWGIRAMGQQAEITGESSKLRRVLFKGARIKNGGTHPGQIIINGRNNWLEYCEIDDCDSRGVRVETAARGGGVLHCYFHDFNEPDTAQVYEPIQIGEGSNTFRLYTDPADGFRVGWCYAENCNRYNQENECPSVKAPFAILNDYHIHNSKNIQMRFARNTSLYRCRVTGNGFFGIQGPDHYFENCEAENAIGFRFFMSNWNSDAPGNPPSGAGAGAADAQYPSVERPKMTGCKGNVEFGHKPESFCTLRVQNAELYGKVSGTIKNTQGGLPCWTEYLDPLVPLAPAARWTAFSQGLLAGLPT